MKVSFKPIGVIHTPFQETTDMPIQPAGALGIQGAVEIYPQYAEGLQDLEGFSHIFLLYYFHRVDGFKLTVKPFLDDRKRGLFATRAPRRPNPIGLSVVRLLKREGNILHIENVDILDGTPLLDIKPYVPEFDQFAAERVGWLEGARGKVQDQRSDARFEG